MKPENSSWNPFTALTADQQNLSKEAFARKREKSSFIFVLLVTKHLHLTQPKGNIILSIMLDAISIYNSVIL